MAENFQRLQPPLSPGCLAASSGASVAFADGPLSSYVVTRHRIAATGAGAERNGDGEVCGSLSSGESFTFVAVCMTRDGDLCRNADSLRTTADDLDSAHCRCFEAATVDGDKNAATERCDDSCLKRQFTPSDRCRSRTFP